MPFAEPLCGLLRPEHADARGCQLDAERQAVDEPADPGDGRPIGFGERERRHEPPRTLDVELDRGDPGERVDRPVAGSGDLERPEPVLALGRDAERLAARGEDRQVWHPFEEVGDERRRALQMLEVVEGQRLRAARERLDGDVERSARRVRLRVEGPCDRARDRCLVLDGGELDERRRRDLRRRRACDRRLPDAAGAGDRHEAGRSTGEQRDDRRHVEVAADELCSGVRRPVQLGAARREQRVVRQDAALERAQLGRRLEAELVERGARLPGTRRARRPAGHCGRARASGVPGAARGAGAPLRASRARRRPPHVAPARGRPRCAPRVRSGAPRPASRPPLARRARARRRRAQGRATAASAPERSPSAARRSKRWRSSSPGSTRRT